MLNLISRLAKLEQRIPREVHGYQTTRRTAAGEIIESVIFVSARRPGEKPRSFTPEAFHRTFPDGRVTHHTILVDDGTLPDRNSLAAHRFGAELER